MQALYIGRSKNKKTGYIGGQFIGETREESKASCEGCPLLYHGCYAHGGTEAMAHTTIIREHNKGKDYSLNNALKNTHPLSRYFRMGRIGDPSAVDNYIADDQKIRADPLTRPPDDLARRGMPRS